MPDSFEAPLDKAFFPIGFILFVFVATGPESFIRGITLGRFGSADVSPIMLRFTQTMAGFAALAIAVSFIVGLVMQGR